MVSFKGKESKTNLMATRILDENRAPSNKENFKMAGDPSRKIIGKDPMAGFRKTIPLSSKSVATDQVDLNRCKGKAQDLENVAGKRESIDAKVRTGRRALADLSNLNNNSSNQYRNELNNNPKIKKDKLVGSNISQGKTTAGSKTYRHRISLSKSVVRRNASSKTIGEMKSSARATARLSVNDGTSMKRNTSTEINSGQGYQNKQSIDSSKLVKNQGVKLSRPRLSFTSQKAMDMNTLSRKPIRTRDTNIQANSKLRRAPIAKLKSNVGKSIAAKPSHNKVSGDDESVSSQVCESQKVESDGSGCSSDNVTLIISRSKCNRRKSYTSSLVEKSEIMGEFAGSANFIKKDELKNIDDNTNPLEVVEYVDDIYQYYWSMEVQNPLPANYMALQLDITPRMRGILINWLIEVHLKFHLMQETLFLMVQLLDRVLSVVPTKKDELQMVGLTALLLASKYEDYWHPKINELIAISANSLTREQILAMEKFVLRKLNFRLNLPTVYVFMMRFLKAAECDKKLEHLAFYLIELCLREYEALKWRPSLLCASAIYVARCTLQISPAWTGLLRKYAHYGESQLKDCAKMILTFHQAACLKPTQILYEKYSSPDRSCVAAISAMDVIPTCP